jgi:CubicO group peptidase (beta-lactamase class C family)
MRRFYLFLAAIILIPQLVLAQPKTKVDTKKLNQYFEQMVKDWDIPSVSIGVVKDGKLVFTGSYGFLETGKNQKSDENTLYGIASNSKAFTATIISMLVQEGKLNWNDKVKKFLPYFAVYDNWVSENVTIRDLLSHRVGLGTFSGDVIWYKSDFSAEDIVKKAKFIPKAFDFRAGYGYSNVMYIAAGEVIKAVTGKPWSVNVKERIFEPLGMNRTVTTPKQLEGKGNFVTPHARENNVNIPIAWEDWEEIGALGGIISSVNDLSKWMIMNLNHGIYGSDTLIRKSNLNLLWTPHANFVVDHTSKNDFNRHFSAYGLGWGLSDFNGRLRVSHTGAIDGMITAVTLIPDDNFGVVVLTNGMQSPITAATNYVIDQFLGTGTRDWSAELLKRTKANEQSDNRILSRKEKRVAGTNPSLPLDKYTGTYRSDIHGDIHISLVDGKLRMDFEHSSYLSATLSHWHYDVWEIVWDNKHAWFNFGTVKFNTDNNLNVLGMDFDVPNDDIFFEELKPYKVKSAGKK